MSDTSRTVFSSSRRAFLQSATSAALLSPILTEGRLKAQGVEESSKRRPIRIAQIGVGHGHASKISTFRESSDYEVVAIAEPDESLRLAAQNHKAYQGLPWRSQEELLADSSIEAVLVETRVRDLLNTAEACIAAGKHVHLDKPAGASLPQFQRLLEAADSRKLIIQMGYMWRYHPAVLLLWELLQNNWLGEVFEVTAVIGKSLSQQERKELAEFPGGIMFELGCHMIDLVVGVLGPPEEVTSFAQKSSQDNLTDNVIAVLKYPRALANVRINALEVDGGPRRRFIVNGTEGTLHIQPMDGTARARLTLSQAKGKYVKGDQNLTFGPFPRYVGDAAELARWIRGEAPIIRYTREHDLAVQRAVLLAGGMSIE